MSDRLMWIKKRYDRSRKLPKIASGLILLLLAGAIYISTEDRNIIEVEIDNGDVLDAMTIVLIFNFEVNTENFKLGDIKERSYDNTWTSTPGSFHTGETSLIDVKIISEWSGLTETYNYTFIDYPYLWVEIRTSGELQNEDMAPFLEYRRDIYFNFSFQNQ
jgi:hypothetical protein